MSTRAAINEPLQTPVTARVALIARAYGRMPQETMHRPYSTSDATNNQRSPRRRPIQPAATSPGISAMAATPNDNATSDGLPPSSTIRTPMNVSDPWSPANAKAKTASTSQSRG